MTHFTVEVTTNAVSDSGWAHLRRVLDMIPGTVLLEDADEPVLMIPVDATTTMRAALFVDGIAKLTGIVIVSGRIYPTPEVDFDAPLSERSNGQRLTEVAQLIEEWMDRFPVLDGHIAADGRLVEA